MGGQALSGKFHYFFLNLPLVYMSKHQKYFVNLTATKNTKIGPKWKIKVIYMIKPQTHFLASQKPKRTKNPWKWPQNTIQSRWKRKILVIGPYELTTTKKFLGLKAIQKSPSRATKFSRVESSWASNLFKLNSRWLWLQSNPIFLKSKLVESKYILGRPWFFDKRL